MKRDMDLIRHLLLKAEASDGTFSVHGNLETYQVEQMIDAGLIDGRVSHEIGATARQSFIHRLTWEGHDFLDAARDETLWSKAKEKFLKPSASFTFEILKGWLKSEITKHLPGLS